MTWAPRMTFGDADPQLRDTMDVEAQPSVREVMFCIHESDAAQGSATIHLDETRARELFNWLGVWLHRS